MNIIFDDPDFERLAFDPTYVGRWNWDIKKRYQKVIVAFQAISCRESLFPLSGMNFKLLAGKRKKHRRKDYDKEYSVRLNHRFRIVITFAGIAPTESIIIIDVEDYH